MNATLVAVLFAVFGFGVILAWLGRRGRRLNDHPQCRDCGFDLAGVYPATITCPECGSGLKRPRAVRDGVRKRMGWLVALGVLIALLPLAPLATVLYAGATGTNLARYTPTGVLLWQTRISSPALNKQIADELIDRLIKKQLDKAQATAVAERVLQLQADRSFAWDEVWGDLIERLNLNGSLSAEQLNRFHAQTVSLSGRCRTTVRAGDPLPIAVTLQPGRVGSSSQLMAFASLDAAKLGETTLRKPTAGTRSQGLFAAPVNSGSELYFYFYGTKMTGGWMAGMGGTGGTQTQEQIVVLTVPKATDPGERTLTATVLCRVSDAQNGWSSNGVRMKAGDPGVAAFTITQRVTVLPADAEPVKLSTPTPAAEKQLRELLASSQVSAAVSASSSFLPFIGGLSVSRNVTLQLTIDKSATPFAFDVFIRIRGKETKLGQLSSSAAAAGADGVYTSGFYSPGGGAGSRIAYLSAEVSNLQKSDKVADLIFRPSTRAAVNTLDLTEIYGGEIVLKDVGLARDGGASGTTFSTTVVGTAIPAAPAAPTTDPEPPEPQEPKEPK